MLDRPGDMSPQQVSHSLTSRLISHHGVQPLEVELVYDPECPYATTATFRTGGVTVSWTFARDLLRHGQFEPVGSGDVHVRPEVDDNGQAAVHIELHSPHGAAIVVTPAREIHDFVERTTATVRPGTESRHLDIDGAIDAVLVGTSGD